MPLGLKKWLDLLVDKPLPVVDRSMPAVKAQMANPQLALVDYARPVLDDPALTVQLLKKANQSRQSSLREPLTTLSNALSHLGRGQLEQQMVQAQTLEELGLSDRNHEGYRTTVAAACHSSSLALDWAQQRNIHEPEEMQLAALLQFIAEMSLWCYGGRVMGEIESRCYGRRLDYNQAGEQVLGCSIRALAAALAKAWVLPELVIQGLEVKTPDFTLASGVMLASRLARLVQHSWYDQSARQCLDDIARYKGRSLSEVVPQIHQNAVTLSNHFIALGLSPPARLLPMLVDENYVDPEYLEGEVLSQTPGAEQKKSDINPELASKLVSIKTMVEQHVSAGVLIQAVVEAIELSGFERVVFAVKVPQKKLLYGRFFAQGNTDRPFKGFNISIAQPNLFSLLMNKSQCLWVNNENRGKFWSRVPDEVKLMLHNESFMAMSIFTQKHSVGLMYADRIKGELTQNEYRRFQGLCKILMDGMIEISHHRDG